MQYLKQASSHFGGLISCAYDVNSRDNVLRPVRQADILVAAVGCAEVVKADWVKLGATVVDVGINGS